MIITSLIRRTKGHTVVMDGEIYEFNPGNDYQCSVANPDHAAHLISICEGYIAVEEDIPAKAPARRVKVRRFVPVPPQADVTHEGVE